MSFDLILPFFPEELRALLLDPSISDLMINGTTGVFADRNGVVERIELRSPYTNERLQAAIERVARILGQDLTTQNPVLNTRLPDGSRVAVVGPPSSVYGPTLTVRKFNRWFTSDDLIASGSLPAAVRDRVVGLIGKRKNGIIAGGTGSGKTTLMKALLDHVPLHERLIVIEQPAELKIAHPNAVRWEAVAAIPGQVAVTRGLRDYGVEGQIGLESTPEAYVEKLVDAFRQVRRVLRRDGTVWLNIGDTYFGSWGNYGGQNRGHGLQREIVHGSAVPNPAYDGLEGYRPPKARAV